MLRKRLQSFDPMLAVTVALIVAALVAVVFAIGAQPASAASGGVSIGGTSGKPGKAKLKKNGKAIPPSNAPKRVVRAIEAANRIRKKPYKWGGGHSSFNDNGYDCSGAVSYVLRGARMLKRPMASGGLMSWGKRGKGKWITVYAHGGHAFVEVAGLRFDTSGSGGKGPRWRKEKRSKSGFKVRHFKRY
jgi:cell wall-associated NlpC family hydrolase